MRLREKAAKLTVVGRGWMGPYNGKHGLALKMDTAADALEVDYIDSVIVPGGWAPDRLRRLGGVKDLVWETYRQGKNIGTIYHSG